MAETMLGVLLMGAAMMVEPSDRIWDGMLLGWGQACFIFGQMRLSAQRRRYGYSPPEPPTGGETRPTHEEVRNGE